MTGRTRGHAPAQSIALTVLTWVLLTTPAWAQSATSGAIAGVVRDTTGAVLPGVTVEAASPVLIEKVRVVVTDTQGNYKIIGLRPGSYTVTFTLPGFATFKREGVELTTGFTATANAEMKVGALEETVTVTGASPIVDIQNVRTQNVLSREVLDTLPTGKAMQGFAALTLGAVSSRHDVGGITGEAATEIALHGASSNDLKRKLDGMDYSSLDGYGGGQMARHRINLAGVQEVVLETGSNAESETGGIQLNHVPKEGSNRFSLYGETTYANGDFQQENLSDALRARGLTKVPPLKRTWDNGWGVGGPVMRDRLWFYAANRFWGTEQYQPDAYFNKTLNTVFYTPDLDRPSYLTYSTKDVSGRFTWQAARKHKVTFSEIVQRSCNCWTTVNSLQSPEAAALAVHGWNHLPQVTWTYTASNRLLFQAGASNAYGILNSYLYDGITENTIGITELSSGLKYGAFVGLGSTNYGQGLSNTLLSQGSVSYVSGSHAYKFGLGFVHGWWNQDHFVNQSIDYSFRFGVPVSLNQWASPAVWRSRLRTVRLYAQDQWTLRKLTLNYGLRFDRLRGYNLEEHVPAGRFVPARDFAAVDDVPNWKDVAPRLGGAYDLFGNGKTAIKASLGRYVASMGIGFTEPSHPVLSMVTSTSRTWNDANGNYTPDCDLLNRAANGECGAIANSAFGTTVVNTRYGSDVLLGWGARPYNWQAAATMQHELVPGIGVNVGYFRTWYGNFTVTDNLAVTPADFDPYCITTPVDARLPGSGQQLCGLYDVRPGKFGQVNNLVTQVSDFGKRTSVYNGVDVGVAARFGKGGLLQGGISTSQTVTDNCVAVDSPQARLFCHVSPPWSAGTQIKLAGAYPLPRGLQMSATFQNLPGIAQAANLPATNAQIAPSLGRNLAACPAAGTCTATATIPLMPLNTYFEDRLTQLDLRLTRIFRFGTTRVQGMLDVYNVFNASAILGINTTYGPQWLRPNSVMGARMFKLGAQVDF